MGRTELAQVAERYAESLANSTAWVVVALALGLGAAATLWFPDHFRRLERGRPRAAMLALVVAIAVVTAIQLGWVADDAFISFRYARNWVEGHGLVYNPGERVEGYTNFLWVAVLAPFQWLGLHLALPSIGLSLICQAASLVLTARLAQRIGAPGSALPLAALLLALNYVFASFGTSGMETMLGTLLVLAALERASAERPLAAGVFGILAAMTHPDHAIFYASLGFCLLLGRDRWRTLPRFAAPFLLIYLPYFACRFSYYGEFFPNTYYAKNADLSYFSQGAVYLLMSGLTTGLWAALPLAAYGALRFRHHLVARFAAVATPLFLIYVAKVGGDFMLGRLLCPLLPPLFVLAELGLRDLAAMGGSARTLMSGASAAWLALAVIVPAPIPREREKYLHVADERTFYAIESYLPLRLRHRLLRKARDIKRVAEPLPRPPRISAGAIGIMGYETGLPLIDGYGLTNRALAHWRTRRRGRPGHEKSIAPGLLLAQEVDLARASVYPTEYRRIGYVGLKGYAFNVVRYDAQLFSALRQPGVRGPSLLSYLDDYQPPRGPGSESRLDCDLWHARRVYFENNDDAKRRARWVQKVIKRRPEWRGYEDFLLTELRMNESPSASRPWRAVAGLQFDARGSWTLSGAAFADSPVRRESAGQQTTYGARGSFLNSYTEREGDLARGTLLTEPFEIRGDAITLQVAGGHSPRELRVELLVQEHAWFSATGCDSEVFGQRLWVTKSLVGNLARIRVVDEKRGGWGHLLVDDLVQWARPQPPATTATASIEPD